MGAFHIVSNTVSVTTELMPELRHLHHVFMEMEENIRREWIPSALNKHADNFRCTSNSRDLAATPSSLKSVANSLQLKAVQRNWPLLEAPAVRQKVVMTQFEDYWGTARAAYGTHHQP